MKLEFLHTEESNTRLILLFAGWSAGSEVGRGVSMPGWDVAVAYDFTDMRLDCSFLSRYYTVYLFAWSLGVCAAEAVLPAERITSAFALNGTARPVHDLLGIPAAIYLGTAEGLSERSLQKFRLRMAGDKVTLGEMGDCPNSDIENLRAQLFSIRDAAGTLKGNPRLPWLRAYLSANDRIFPFENMKRFWESAGEIEIIPMEAPHYVPLHRIVGAVIADTEKVSRRFSKASVSYDTHAIAQYSVSLKLADKFAAMHPAANPRVLEIGCGTGLFTHEYARLVHPSQATFVDITQTGPFGVADSEEYVVEDAERWIERQEREWDAIVSASAIQWFADIPRFLHLCFERLAPGGVLAVSTFSPGNLGELDEFRPSPLLYPKAARLEEWLLRDFEEVTVEEEEIKVEFRSVREMLMHLKHTGVAGSAGDSSVSLTDMSKLRNLTYRPLYLTARKPKN